jgi:hypothetical protein
MKKTYQNPTLEVVRVETQQMLALSKGDEYNSSDVTYSRESFFDGEY